MASHGHCSIAVPASLVARATRWLGEQRDRFRPLGRPLSESENRALAPHFPARLRRAVRVAVVPRLLRPGLRDTPPALRLPELLGFDHLEAISLDDTLVFSRAAMPAPERVGPVLFHEMVHVAQYRLLGRERFLRAYLEGWASGFDYEAIPLERVAFDLEARYIRDPRRPVPVGPVIEGLFRASHRSPRRARRARTARRNDPGGAPTA